MWMDWEKLKKKKREVKDLFLPIFLPKWTPEPGICIQGLFKWSLYPNKLYLPVTIIKLYITRKTSTSQLKDKVF